MMLKIDLVIGCATLFCFALAADRRLEDRYMHPDLPFTPDRGLLYSYVQENSSYWIDLGQEILQKQLQKVRNENVAKNVIFFIGDGMSIPTIAASRVYANQGEETELAFDKFPYVGLSKTYCVDRQVADSACTATAYLTGVKANYQTIGVTAAVNLNDCDAMNNTELHTHSIAAWSQKVGKRTGLVTTTRVTHASPSGVYAHTANRNWESDTDVWEAGHDPNICHDIADQLVNGETGKNLNVILGGGRGEFLPKETTDEEGDIGFRTDKRNLIEEWLEDKEGKNAKYVWNKRDLIRDNGASDYLLGLFDASHTPYNLDRDKASDPSLEEMVEAAIKVLRKGPEGYFLFVEGGRIDTAHHEAKARKSFDEVAELSKAIQKAVEMTDEDDTLLVVSSDHAHSMTYSGYPNRGRDVLGLSGLTDQDRLPYFTINYANGPGYRRSSGEARSDPTKERYQDKDFVYPGMFPLEAETHGGDDVGIFARGPFSHLFTGVIEQHSIPHIMAYASCVGDGLTACDGGRGNRGGQSPQGRSRSQSGSGRGQSGSGRGQSGSRRGQFGSDDNSFIQGGALPRGHTAEFHRGQTGRRSGSFGGDDDSPRRAWN